MQLVDVIKGKVNSQKECSKEGADLEGRNRRYPALSRRRLFISKLG